MMGQRHPRSYRGVRRPDASTNRDSDIGTRKHRPDYMLVIYMTLLLALGAVTVYAISPGITTSQNLDENFFSFKQLTAIGVGVLAFAIASIMDVKIWKSLAIPLVIVSGAVAAAVRTLGDPINGAYRWLEIGGVSFQAAELIKFSIILWLAGYLVKRRIDKTMDHPETMKALGVAVVTVIIVVAGLQSDLGSAAVMLAIIGFMVFVAGMPYKRLFLVGAVVMMLIGLTVITSSYRRDRVATFLNPTADCQDEGYQACQALITVGSGGMFGKGLGRSVQAYGYLPEAANDSIFAIVSEKFGFVGSSLMIGVFIGLFRRIKNVAENAPNDYTRLLVSGILAWLSVQMIINIGAMLGLLPLKGITLPLVSYGGTSIIFVMAAIGIVFQVSRYADLSGAQNARQYGQRRPQGRSTRVAGKRSWGRT